MLYLCVIIIECWGWISLAACDLLTSPASSQQALIAQSGRSYRGNLCLCSSKVSSILGDPPAQSFPGAFTPHSLPWRSSVAALSQQGMSFWLEEPVPHPWRSFIITRFSKIICLPRQKRRELPISFHHTCFSWLPHSETSNKSPRMCSQSSDSVCWLCFPRCCLTQRWLSLCLQTPDFGLTPPPWCINWPPAEFPFFGFISWALSSLPSGRALSRLIIQ